jgi:hypothetical protein
MEAAEHTVADLIANINSVGPNVFARDVVHNMQRTSTRNGILKAEAAYLFALALDRHGAQRIQEVPKFGTNASMECEIRSIPGQHSGIALKYFFMLCGDEDLIKPDRMTLGFLADALARPIPDDREAQRLISGACSLLNQRYPALTPRALDHLIWRHQRGDRAKNAR